MEAHFEVWWRITDDIVINGHLTQKHTYSSTSDKTSSLIVIMSSMIIWCVHPHKWDWCTRSDSTEHGATALTDNQCQFTSLQECREVMESLKYAGKNSPYHNFVSETLISLPYPYHRTFWNMSGHCPAALFLHTSSARLQREEATVSEPSNTSGNRTWDVGQAGKQEVRATGPLCQEEDVCWSTMRPPYL